MTRRKVTAEAIVGALRTAGRPLNRYELAEALDVSVGPIIGWIHSLVQEGELAVELRPSGHFGRMHYYKLRTTPESE